MRRIAELFLSWGPAGLFFFALADGAGVPIPGGVDALIVFLASKGTASIALLGLLAVTGSVMGNFILYSIAKKGGEIYLRKHTISRSGKKFREWFQHYGLLTVFISALVPLPVMPMKIFVVCSGALGANPYAFIAVFMAARFPRYLGLAYLGAQMGDNAFAYLKAHRWDLVWFAVVLTVVLFAMVKIFDWWKARQAH